MVMKKCSKCCNEYDLSQYHKDGKSGRLRSACKFCERLRRQIAYLTNENIRVRIKKYAQQKALKKRFY